MSPLSVQQPQNTQSAAEDRRTGRPTGVTKAFVLSKAKYFRDVQLWPLESRMKVDGWLSNFRAQDAELAALLLHSFTYYSNALIDELFVSAFTSISSRLFLREGNPRKAWSGFVDSLIVCPVEGEDSNVTDSGHSFARRARQLLGIPESNILPCSKALSELNRKPTRPMIFVDDISGTGSQFISTWQREYDLGDGTRLSFERFRKVNGGTFIYCPTFATWFSRENIGERCKGVSLLPAHTLTKRDSALTSESNVWPPQLLADGRKLVRQYSAAAGIPKKGDNGWQGFGKLGLTIGFEHSIPDVTLPIFFWELNGWKPLIPRT